MKNGFMNQLSNLKLVIFDLDGTLIDSNGINNDLDIELAHLFDENKNPEEIIIERDNFFKSNTEGDIYLNYCEYLKTKYNSDFSKEEILQIRRNLSKKFSKDIKYKPDADKMIKYLKNQNINIALGTVSRRETIDIYINENEHMKSKCNLQEYFDFIEIETDIGEKIYTINNLWNYNWIYLWIYWCRWWNDDAFGSDFGTGI